ncbi:MAG: bis(5'-nucleosyl)-tetraphosphatase (symmetrical) YqeK [Candidatus Hydrogenedentota bacterium]
MPLLQTPRAAEFLELLRARLSEKTLKHTLSVAQTMLGMADQANINPDKAVTAGLLHDSCKDLEPATLVERAEEYGISLTEAQRANPSALLHGPVAAEEAWRTLAVEDPEVYDAIYWHTTGKPELGRLGQALYVADFCEPTRPIPQAAEARRILDAEGFERALLYVTQEKAAHVRAKGAAEPTTEAFLEWVNGEFGS